MNLEFSIKYGKNVKYNIQKTFLFPDVRRLHVARWLRVWDPWHEVKNGMEVQSSYSTYTRLRTNCTKLWLYLHNCLLLIEIF